MNTITVALACVRREFNNNFWAYGINAVGQAIKDTGADIIMGTEFLFYEHPKPLSADFKRELTHILCTSSMGSDALIVPGTFVWDDEGYYRNTAPIIHNGEIIHEYEKQSSNGGDAESALDVNLTWAPNPTNKVFNWHGHSVGIQICIDLVSAPLPCPVDISLMPSFGYISRPSAQSVSLFNSGLFLHADGRHARTLVYTRANNCLEEIVNPARTIECGSIEFDVYEAPLPAKNF